MSHDQDERAANKELVLTYSRRAQAGDVKGMAECLADDCVRVTPRPTFGEVTEGRGHLLGNLPHLSIYQPGTLKMEVENIMAEGPFVAIQMIIRATTAGGEAYENYYHHLFECHDGKISRHWEYCDTLYGAQMLYGAEVRGLPAKAKPARGAVSGG